ncbi:MAG: hypothetical protein MRY77_14480 [Rhodobacteraceae bacterium]|nr:hypothetical protein [Paracoccaceae bacterium]
MTDTKPGASSLAPLNARIEVFRPGTFTPMEGQAITYSAADLKAVADAYDPETAPAPIVVGHPNMDTPAYGWVKGFEYDEQSERLFANLHEIEPQFADLVKQGRFKKVSMCFFGPDQPANPSPGAWYPKHVGFLGAAAPAVSGLKNVEFTSNEAVTFTTSFGERGFEETASLFRLLRDFLIDAFDMEAADKALPSWRIEWLDEMEISTPDNALFAAPPSGSIDPAPDASPKTTQREDPPVTKETEANFAAREAHLSEREKTIASREAKLAHDDNVSFAEGLVADGKLLPASRDKVVAILDALPAEESVSFSNDGEKLAPGAALREVLEAQPKVVSYGEYDLPDDVPGAAKPASFAADGLPVDPAGLELHNKALAYQRQNPGTDYMAAVHAVT